MVIVDVDGKRAARNVTHVRKLPKGRRFNIVDQDDMEVDDDLDPQPDVQQQREPDGEQQQPRRRNPPRQRRLPGRYRNE